MEILQNREIHQMISSLWKQYLTAEIVNDILMEEIREQLYLENVSVPGEKNSPAFLDGVARLAFSDRTEDIVSALFSDKESWVPYSELTQFYDAPGLYDILLKNIVGQLQWYDDTVIADNPYCRTVSFQSVFRNNMELKYVDTLPYEFFQTYPTCQKTNPFLYATAGFFTTPVSFPVILENNEVWMSIVVSEIESMMTPIEKACGHVITYGLGLGYYPFMTSEKPEVESVTVVEMNPTVISLFKEHILPQFPHKEKIHIIEADALSFVKTQKDGLFDVAFFDFWAGYFDGLSLYKKLLPRTVHLKKTTCFYWIETCFMNYFFRPVVMKFLMEKGTGRSFSLPPLSKEVNRMQHRFASYLNTCEGCLSAPEDIDRLLSDGGLLPLIREFAENDNSH